MIKAIVILAILVWAHPRAHAAQNETSVLTLESFLDAAREQSPDLAAARASTSAAKARAVGIRLMPPMVGLMQMREGPSRTTGIEVSQEIPIPTKILKERKLRLLQSQAQEASSSAETASALSDARYAYVSAWAAGERVKILKKKLAWLRTHAKLARSTARYDTSGRIHLLEIEAQRDETENEVIAAEAEVTERLNQLTVFTPQLKISEKRLEEPKELSQTSIEGISSPIVNSLEKTVEAKTAQLALRKSTYLPDFFVRYQAFDQTEEIPQSQELMVGVTLPFLYFWQPRADIAEANAEKLRAEAEVLKAKTALSSGLQTLLTREQSTRAQLKNLKEKLLPRSEQRSRLVRNISQRTMEGLDQHNTVMLSHLNFELSAIALRLKLEEIAREIVSLTGQVSGIGGK